jgi:Cyclin, N-terminal domain
MMYQIEEIKDEIAALIHNEEKYYLCYDYMSSDRHILKQNSWEQQIVIKICNIDPEYTDIQSLHHVDSFDCHHMVKQHNVFKSISTGDVMDLQQHQESHTNVVVDMIEQQQQQQQQEEEKSFQHWRKQMFDWACMVVDTFRIDRQAVAMSFNLLDRFVAIELNTPGAPPVTRDDYQLFSMVCLYIVVKLIESNTQHHKLSTSALVEMSRNFYSKEVIEATEYEICNALNWYLHAPTAIGYCRLMIALFPEEIIDKMSKEMIITATTLTEIAVSQSCFVSYKPSLVGLAAVVHAARLDGISKESIMDMCKQLDGLISIENNDEFRLIYSELEKLYCL